MPLFGEQVFLFNAFVEQFMFLPCLSVTTVTVKVADEFLHNLVNKLKAIYPSRLTIFHNERKLRM